MEIQYLKNIKKGMKVEILTKQNRISKGIVDAILTKDSYNLYGIMVALDSGEVGRVQKIILSDNEKDQKEISEIKRLIEKGENFYSEFKLSLLWSQNYTEEDIKKSRSYDVHYYKQRASKIIIAKSIAAFLNSDGGNLILGVREKKEAEETEIIGVFDEFKKLKDSNKDGYKRMIVDEIIRPYFPAKISNHLNQYLSINFIELEGKILCWIKIKKSEGRVFLKINDKEIFMIRIETENRLLEGEKLVDYCIGHFR
jgi:uncharacterized repeat protein (TIGR03833 family)